MTDQGDVQEALERYVRYVRPLEAGHLGEFAAVSEDGEVVLAPTLHDAVDQASGMASPAIAFKVGEQVVGHWMSRSSGVHWRTSSA